MSPPPTAAPTGRSIIALIPARDEGPRIEAVVRGVAAHLPVVVVDDGSSDDSAARASAAGATVIVQRPNRGKGAALRTGFAWALERDVAAALTLDGDGQHDPADIPAFLAAWATGEAELIVGERDFGRMGVARRLANVLGGLAFSWAVGRPIPDNQSGYRLVGRRLMAILVESRESGFEFEVEMLTTAIRAGSPIAWLPIRTVRADRPSHIRPLDHLRGFAGIVRRARRDVRRPLDGSAAR